MTEYTYVEEAFNQLADDETYHYFYDAEGNRQKRMENADNDNYVLYVWDQRNRLAKVETYLEDVLVRTVNYAYDAGNQLIRREVTEHDGVTTTPVSDRFFVYDAVPDSPYPVVGAGDNPTDIGTQGQIVLQFDGLEGDTPELSHRYLWGAGIDFQLADEYLPITNGNGDTRLIWPLVDHLGTVRDLVEYAEFTPGGSSPNTVVLKHRTYDSFGNVLNEYNRGDFDGDGEYTADDIDILFQFIDAQVFGEFYDMDADGDIDVNDEIIMIRDIIRTVYGDANLDGVVDGGDFGVWNEHKWTTGDYGWADADFDLDGDVDGTDWGVLNANNFTGDGQLNTTVLDHVFGFTGRLLDQETGLQNNLNRWYDAGVGRWVSEDPVGFKNEG